MPEQFRRNIELYQLFISVILVMGAMFTTWVSLNSRIAILETKQESDDKFHNEVIIYFKDLKDGQKSLEDGQTKILIELQNKKNR